MFQNRQAKAFNQEVEKTRQEVAVLENILGLAPVSSGSVKDLVARKNRLKAQAAERLDLEAESRPNFTPVFWGDL